MTLENRPWGAEKHSHEMFDRQLLCPGTNVALVGGAWDENAK